MTRERNPKKGTFKQFLSYFPPVVMPITVGEGTHHTFSKENKPLPEQLIVDYIAPLEEEKMDEFTEFVPCFSFKPNPKTRAIVYWRAGLLHYAYILVTFDAKGNFISRSIMSQFGLSDAGVQHSALTIREDFIVYVAEAAVAKSDTLEGTKAFNLEIMPTGEIITYDAKLN